MAISVELPINTFQVSVCFKYEKYQYFTSIISINSINIFRLSNVSILSSINVFQVAMLLEYQKHPYVSSIMSINTFQVSKESMHIKYQYFSSIKSSVPTLTEKSVKYIFYIKICTCTDYCTDLLKNTEFVRNCTMSKCFFQILLIYFFHY